ncbi:hypothetical protein BSK59_32855 [Paenibacillus odorifer]|uniref:hypothetical protein n=1 Tax=Paenibacillus odorifer TaxID=189426 RepID=UPI00096D36B7|nr:hypothetical protein [Paenibacillus odorifer]OME45337.1 hypothetical protein BSK59_32855 [Paenibacillus odorifer]
MKEIYSRKRAAKAVGVSPRTILRAIQARQLDSLKIGDGKTSTYIIERDDLMKYSAKRKERKCQ